ncbi:hypothetical protein SAMN05421874_128136 [Nonomuraea maritima]|uniref:Uncharacterized protein n=1 Tax=Nonomuraea maritima TaxID=683260 RepID=A0A1G9MQQ7_9ACTN|nr:hypothetical protein [Nonomuraea maritima]SDL76351.1 hypothetical protein SAMN05421874_128136 [Nonomuraea maritima]
MIGLVLGGGFSFGLGWVFAGIRKKDKLPGKPLGVLAVLLLLVFSASMFLLPTGYLFVNFGAWLVEMAARGSMATLFGSVVLFLLAAAFSFLAGAVVKDIAKDAKPDMPTFVACSVLWIFGGIAYGSVWGPVEYAEFTAEVMRQAVENWS